jgi:hypothetical protein
MSLTAKLMAGGMLTGFALASLPAGAAAQQKASRPDFSSNNAGWLTFHTNFSVVPGATSPMHDDPDHPFVSNQVAARTGQQPTYFIADLANNTILKPWVVERMKKDNAEVLAGKIGFTANSSCMPGGVPGFHLFGFQPLYFILKSDEFSFVFLRRLRFGDGRRPIAV